MKAKTLQIVWHSKEPVFSVDFHPDGYMATGGADKEIKIWELTCAADGSPNVRWAASLEGHNATVNCVRFSKTGHCLASAGDSGEIIVWKPVPAVPAAAADGSSSPKSSTPAITPGTAAAAGSPAPAAKLFGSITATAVPARDAAAAAAGRDQAGVEADGIVRGFKWKMSHTLRGHHDDVCDVAWAHDDAVLLTGSVENEVMMFDVHNRHNLQRLLGHRHYVQGVAWDPFGAWLVSASADRSVRVHGLKPPGTSSKATAANPKSSVQLARDYIHTATLLKQTLPVPATPLHNEGLAAADVASAPAAAAVDAAAPEAAVTTTEQQQHQQAAKPLQTFLFQDESLSVFFRRLAWSPDGSLLAIPAGMSKGRGGGRAVQHATHVYVRGSWTSPAVSLPCPARASTAVKFCPLLFKLRQPRSSGGSNSPGAEPAAAAAVAAEVAPAAEGSSQAHNALGLPYRLVLAVATVDTVLLYDMQTLEPFMLVGPLHYDQITDLAWSRDGSCLAVSSRDGYCSLLAFKPGELGDVITEQELPAQLVTVLQKVAAAAAATAAKHSAASSHTAAVSPIILRPVGAAAAGASPAPISAVTTQQQQQQRPAIKRIQPQAVAPAAAPAAGSPAAGVAASTAGTAAVTVKTASSQPRRISPSPVTAATPATVAAAGGGVGGSARPPSGINVAAPALRRLTPMPVNTAAAAGCSSSEVVDLTADDQAAAAAPAAVPVMTSSNDELVANSSAAVATAAAVTPPAPQRLTPQAVSPARQQQQQRGPSPVAAAATAAAGCGINPAGAAAASQGRTGMAAVAAALAAAKKKAAAKRAVEGATAADSKADTKRPKTNGAA